MRASSLALSLLGLTARALTACGGPVEPNPRPDTDEDSGDASAGAQLVLGVSEVDFGVIAHGELYTSNLTISNPGEAELVLASLAIEAPFRVSPETLRVRAGGSSTITIFVQATSYQPFDTALVLTAEDAAIGVVEVPVRATVLADEDGDGFDRVEAGGLDCDDGDSAISPDAVEVWYDGVDGDCDGLSDYDQDRDGYESDAFNDDPALGGGDCQDSNVDFNPGAPDEPYDNRDTDCDGWSDWDADRDGSGSAYYGRGLDCDDADPLVNSSAAEMLNARDDDCDEEIDNDVLVEEGPYVYPGSSRFERAGFSVAVGDLDADGLSELVMGAPYYGATSPSGTGKGAVAVFVGGALPATGSEVDDAPLWIEGQTNGDLAGSYVTVLGDHDGDGVGDLAIGATGRSSGAGAVYVLSGDDVMGGSRITDALSTISGTSGNALGRGIATGVDLDADGADELVMSYASGGSNAVALVYGGSPRSIGLSSADASYTTSGTGTAFYRNAPVGGDLDGDGYGDLVLSDDTADVYGLSNNGAVWVLWGGTTRWSGTGNLDSVATIVGYGTSSSAGVGELSQLVSDADGDGDDELWLYDSGAGTYVVPGGPDRRAAFGDPSGVATAFIAADSDLSDPSLLRGIGDWTGDGVGDVMMQVDDTGTGRLRIYPGGLLGSFAHDDAMLGEATGSSAHDNDNVGYGLSPRTGDLDGDGAPDAAAGDPGYSSNMGEVYLLVNGAR